MGESYTVEQVAEFEQFMRDPGRRQAFAEVKRRYDRVFSAVFSTPWAILDSYMEVVASVLVEHLAGDRPSSEEVAARLEAARRPAPADSEAGVAVIPMHGVIMPKASALAESSGGMSIERFRGMFRDAMSNRAVTSIVLDVDSPGGSVSGVPEMAAELRAARGRKPIIAAISGMGASAAYWLASQADEIVITPSGLTGSIGVVTAHEDVSKAAADKGVKVSLISAGKHKVDGNPFEPLSDEARAHSQEMVDEFYSMFVGDVAKGRRVKVDTVRSGFGEGRVVQAKRAMSEGMVDRIGTVEDVVGEQLAADIVARTGVPGLAAFDEREPVAALTDVPEGWKVGNPDRPNGEGPHLVPVDEPDEEADTDLRSLAAKFEAMKLGKAGSPAAK